MADPRTYIRVHDGMPDHPKIEGLSDAAFRLLITVWCWSSRHLTDGTMPETLWKRRSTLKARKELLDAGLIVQADGHVVMHDYLEHQRSAAEVTEIRAAKGKGGSLGNHVKWHVKRGIVNPECDHCSDQDAIANGSQLRSSDGAVSSGLRENDQQVTQTESPSVEREPSSVDNPPASEFAEGTGQTSSHLRSQTDRKSSPETETETETEVLRADVGRHLPPVDARRSSDEDDDLDKLNDRIEGRIIELLAEHTGRTVDRAWASRIRSQLLDDRETRNPLGYVAHSIRENPTRFLPGLSAVHDQPVPELPPPDPDAYERGAAAVRAALPRRPRKAST